jgi:hypothetical protein
MVEGWQTVISADVIESLFAVAFGFTFAGLCASGCRLVALHLPNFRMLEAGPMVARLAAASDLLGAVLDHAQYFARRPARAPPWRSGHGRNSDCRFVELDVGNRRRHGASSAAECLTGCR